MAAKPNIYAIVGSDDGRVKEEALRLHRELTGGNDDGFTHEMIDGTADNVESAFQICRAVVEALLTMPFFGDGKVVWLRNANFLIDDVTGRSERTLSGVESLKDCLEAGLGKGVVFLLSASGIDKRRAFWKFLEKNATVRVLDKIDTSREGWQEAVGEIVAGRARDLGLRFEPEALELFIMLAGEATRQIGNELEKIDLYLGPDRRLVTPDDVRKMVPLSRAGIVFEIGNALQNGRAGRALELIDQQLESGENAIGLMRASIIPTLRNLFMAKVLSEKKLPARDYKGFAAALDRLPEIERMWLPQKKAGGVNVYPLFLCLRGAEKFTMEGLRGVMESALKADRSLVSTGLDHRLVLHRLVAELTAAVRKK
ncbi:MAG: DNA polymerase III subunit delta [Verrucomicrobia bacterium]|nr:MAG: DNA polymerase III subunit delta [Verrucomicrobiota bacterium]TAE86299.1 MAG: DNA polymerase III subunit delta [Verrucomicrobiota bacterium]TAF23698.1 MAG: DNA polymerase III subunit delta [Verrucomicrobiota bacterium]TAF40259.1 MAG: DNA polymerase III subunit delta [Verrucomicrobiota bacterium]